MTAPFRSEVQLSLIDDSDGHTLVQVSNVGSWWVGTCSCGWKSKIKPDRWRVEQQHRGHVRHEATPLDDRAPRP